jgi:hypothetical protein
MSTQLATTQKDYTRIPPYINSSGSIINNDEELLNFLHYALESSKTFLRSNLGWRVAEINREILNGSDKKLEGVSKSSRIVVNKLRRQGREIVGNAANIRPNFNIRTAKTDESGQDKAATYEDLRDHWWRDREVDATFKEAVTEAANSIGYIFQWPEYDCVTGQVEIQSYAKNYKEVFPYQMGADNNLDKAYSVTVWCEMPIAEFREKFPEYANSVNPDRTAPSYLGKAFSRARNIATGIRGILNRGLDRKTDAVVSPSFPTVDVFYTFTRDDSINLSNKSIKMGTLLGGDLAGHDSYEVPPYDATKDNRKDAKLFPFRRLTIWTKNQILRDGPPKWITFHLPVAELRFNRIPKEFLGMGILNDGRSLEEAINEMLNSIFDRITARANFPIAYDKSLPNHVKQILRKKGLKGLIGKGLEVDMRMAINTIKELFDKGLFEISQYEFQVITSLMELLDYVVGTNDYSNLQRKNQVPAADTLEAFVQSMGVLSVDHEREISRGVAKFGRVWLQFAPQVYTLKRRITVVGSNAVDVKDMDYDPENIVPKLDPKAEGVPYWKRLKAHLEKYNLVATPGSMQERQSTTNKLTLLQMLKSGVPISTRKLYDVFIGDGNYDKIRNEWIVEQEENAKLAAKIRAEVEAISQNAQSPESGGMLGRVLNALQNQNTMSEGRTPTNNSAPRQEIKTDSDGTKRVATATY